MHFRILPGEQEQRLIWIRKNHLLRVSGVTSQTTEGTNSWLDRNNLPLPFSDIHGPYAVSYRDQICPSAFAFHTAANGGHQDSVFISQVNIEPKPVRSSHDAKHCVCWSRGCGFRTCRFFAMRSSGFRHAVSLKIHRL
jgi:hypothetical protein